MNTSLEDVLGFIGLIGWSFQLAPQACAGLSFLLSYRPTLFSSSSSVSRDLVNSPIVEYSPALLLNWAIECLLLHIYCVWTELPYSLQLQPLIFMSFLLLCWIQPFLLKLLKPSSLPPTTKSWIEAKSQPKPNVNKKILELLGLVAIIVISFGLSDYLLLTTFKWIEAVYDSEWPRFLLGLFLNVWSLVGYFPQFRDILRKSSLHLSNTNRSLSLSACVRVGSRSVDGFNFLFMDILGAFFSLGSVLVHSPFDGIAACLYALTILLDMGLVLLCIYVSKINTYQRLRIDRDCEGGLED